MGRSWPATRWFGGGLALLLLAGTARGQMIVQQAVVAESEESIVCDSSAQVLREIMTIPARGIPIALLANAEGIAIVPGMIKGGFIVGVKHGRGVLVVRNEQRQWMAPSFISITGASFGWQIGLQGTDVILVFKSSNSIRSLLSGTLTLGAGASVAAGPVGREATAATDVGLRAEIYSYNRSRGLFAGVALDGSVISVDSYAAARFYPQTAAGQPIPLPPAAGRLLGQITAYTGAYVLPPGQPMPPPGAIPPAAGTISPARSQLIDSHRRLQLALDEQWRRYLALPADVYATDRPAAADTLAATLARFDAVAGNPQYRTLTQQADFQSTHALLRQYSGVPPITAASLPAATVR